MKIIITILMLMSIFVFFINLTDYSKNLKTLFLLNNLLKSEAFNDVYNYLDEEDKKIAKEVKDKGTAIFVAMITEIVVCIFSISLMVILIIGLYS